MDGWLKLEPNTSRSSRDEDEREQRIANLFLVPLSPLILRKRFHCMQVVFQSQETKDKSEVHLLFLLFYPLLKRNSFTTKHNTKYICTNTSIPNLSLKFKCLYHYPLLWWSAITLEYYTSHIFGWPSHRCSLPTKTGT